MTPTAKPAGTQLGTVAKAEPATGAGPEEIEAHIEQTRHELGDTVEALSHKLDVKAQAHQKVGMAKEAAKEKAEMAKEKADAMATRVKASSRRPVTLAVAGGATAAAAVVGAVAWRRKH